MFVFNVLVFQPVSAVGQLVFCDGVSQHVRTIYDFFETCRRVTGFFIFRVTSALTALAAAIGSILFISVGWLFFECVFYGSAVPFRMLRL